MSFINSVQNFGTQLANTAKSVGTGVEKAASKTVDGATKELAEAEDAFKNGTLVEGAAELLDATSTGTAVSGALSAVGLLPEDGPGKEIVSALVNLATPIPTAPLAAMKDLADAFSKTNGVTGKDVHQNCAQSHCPPRPRARYEAIACGRVPGPAGFAGAIVNIDIEFNRAVRGTLDPICYTLFPGSALVLGPWRALQEKIENMIKKALKGATRPGGWHWCPRPPRRPSRPIRQPLPPIRTPGNPKTDKPTGKDILNNPNLSFEDKLFLFMCLFIQDQEDKISKQMEKMKANKSASQDTANGHGQPPPKALSPGERKKVIHQHGLAQGQNALVSGQGLGSMAEMCKGFLPMAMPALKAAVGSIPKVGPILAPMMDFLAPMALDAVGGVASQVGKTGGAGAGASAVRKKMLPVAGQKADEKSKSEALEMEVLKKMTQDLTKMQQALSNVLNNMHNSAMNSIRNIR